MDEKMVEFRNVSFRYEEEGPWVLKDVSFTICSNEKVAVIGHNGSGKSTIAKLMNGLLFPQEGEIIINGLKVNEETIWDIRRDVGMVFQNPDNQFVGTTVQDDVAFGMENRGFPREEMVGRIDETLTAVNMQHELLTEPHRLSGGQKQRVAIASVLAISPKILILDEATAMLDPKGRHSIMETISQLLDGYMMTLITITHDLEEVMLAERVIVMNQGEIWTEGHPRDIFSQNRAFDQIGLDLPFTGKLAEELKRTGMGFNHTPFNHEELLEELWTFYSKT
ncbi:Energy-coupling factor transporter ATP-binding protein EcfA1 [Lentibacillus sp. JNUCC-1]|uniref:energy-coupling factor ABC transporter ATP-binding protein n=1 Tax=Lentibacillus sp. JNUCC-1 TaxID=2654513 RepID=UPI0012E7C5A2|nr:energy-coupling factor ABC transporter ATP-binding protein [Lentibacillus sp. JNUCC-1]MUV38112.1 Energy-coupling factor transporter ATP-binding protein EcfA1 [Lentibacillus sp. JNUCC-1]